MAAHFLQAHGIDLQKEMDNAQERTRRAFAEKDVDVNVEPSTFWLKAIRMPHRSKDSLWDVKFDLGKIQGVEPHRDGSIHDPAGEVAVLDGKQGFLLPSLCHPHIHLDKCFLFSHSKYDDLQIVNGNFTEALELTSKAKARFESDDLFSRGEWLIKESIAAGVTHMRAFVEVDSTVGSKCLDTGLELKRCFAPFCKIQICVFAQDPIFSEGKNHPRGKQLIEEVLGRENIDALGSTPYVENSPDLMRANVEWAISTAMKHRKHLDLHLDYNLDSSKPPLVFYVIDLLRKAWNSENPGKTVVLGHCTRLTLFTADEWRELKEAISDLPVYFIGLPTSDIYMMGKPSEENGGGQRVRGTLQIPQMIKKHSLQGAIGVNNIGNPFTPQGNCDPMSIASMGVGIYQAGTKGDSKILLDCVSSTAKAAIGFPQPDDPLEKEAAAEFVLFENPASEGKRIEWKRQRRTLQEIIYDPPPSRKTFFGGLPVSDHFR